MAEITEKFIVWVEGLHTPNFYETIFLGVLASALWSLLAKAVPITSLFLSKLYKRQRDGRAKSLRRKRRQNFRYMWRGAKVDDYMSHLRFRCQMSLGILIFAALPLVMLGTAFAVREGAMTDLEDVLAKGMAFFIAFFLARVLVLYSTEMRIMQVAMMYRYQRKVLIKRLAKRKRSRWQYLRWL
ncbi:MAG: hypothetical protein VW600_13785 [Ferrovibrio sp.]